MQNAKDTFFLTLAQRLAALNPARTVVLRGLTRPAVLVTENELPATDLPVDSFHLQWTAMAIDAAKPLPLVTLACEISYATDGTTGNAGMDRGRALSAMDGELLSALTTAPHSAPKLAFSSSAADTTQTSMVTRIFWADPVFGPVETAAERLSRNVTVQVLSYQEAGEL